MRFPTGLERPSVGVVAEISEHLAGIEQLDEYRVELVDVGRSWFSSFQLELADASLPENAGNVVASPVHGDHAAA